MKIYVAFRSGLLQDEDCRVLLQVQQLTGGPITSQMHQG